MEKLTLIIIGVCVTIAIIVLVIVLKRRSKSPSTDFQGWMPIPQATIGIPSNLPEFKGQNVWGPLQVVMSKPGLTFKDIVSQVKSNRPNSSYIALIVPEGPQDLSKVPDMFVFGGDKLPNAFVAPKDFTSISIGGMNPNTISLSDRNIFIGCKQDTTCPNGSSTCVNTCDDGSPCPVKGKTNIIPYAIYKI
jgi:hypothetical protein